MGNWAPFAQHMVVMLLFLRVSASGMSQFFLYKILGRSRGQPCAHLGLIPQCGRALLLSFHFWGSDILLKCSSKWIWHFFLSLLIKLMKYIKDFFKKIYTYCGVWHWIFLQVHFHAASNSELKLEGTILLFLANPCPLKSWVSWLLRWNVIFFRVIFPLDQPWYH